MQVRNDKKRFIEFSMSLLSLRMEFRLQTIRGDDQRFGEGNNLVGPRLHPGTLASHKVRKLARSRPLFIDDFKNFFRYFSPSAGIST